MLKWIRNNKLLITSVIAAAILIGIIVGLYSLDADTNNMIVSYITELTWRVEEKPVEISHLSIPQEFDVVYQTYNAIQKESGFDLEPYKGVKATRYSYRVLNHAESGNDYVRINVIVYQNKIIAADICSNSLNGFMHPVTDTSDRLAD